MANLQELIEKSIKNYKEGSIIKGHILEIRPKEFLVDIGFKSEGVIPASEFEAPEEIEIGDEVEVILERL
jgi:small subunit ribosomal protein S1